MKFKKLQKNVKLGKKIFLADFTVTDIGLSGPTVDNLASISAQTRFVAKTQLHGLTG